MKYTCLILIILLSFESCSKVETIQRITNENKDKLKLSVKDSLQGEFDKTFETFIRVNDSFNKYYSIDLDKARKYNDTLEALHKRETDLYNRMYEEERKGL